uniref:Uncharacterized protein n=1 Tax=Colobus angolensis palliatus TaxID=336983 RepID=A0A2K5HHP8_COLAP
MMKAIIPASTWALEESTELENRDFPRRRSSEDWLLSVFPAGQAESEGQLVLERVQDSPPPVASPGGGSIRVSRVKAPSSPGGSTRVWLCLTRHFPWSPFPHGGWTDTSEPCENGLSVQSSSACAFHVCESLTEQSLPSERFEELLTGPSPGEAMK